MVSAWRVDTKDDLLADTKDIFYSSVLKSLFYSTESFKIRDVTQIIFWKDTWVGNNLFKHQFPTIFNITHDPHATVARVMSDEHYNISFRRGLVDDKL
jgi:hypothetical protein